MTGSRWLGALVAIAAALAIGASMLLGPRQVAAEQTVDVQLRETAYATFAGGCFWCMEPPFDKLEGVISTTSGYAGGPEKAPSYEAVASGRTGHTEVVQVAFDPQRISYQKLLQVFWRNIDPFAVNRQFCDRGPQYRSGIFFHDEAQRQAAEASKAAVALQLSEMGQPQPIATEVTALAGSFYPAEDYHQDYYQKNPLRYRYYRNGCGRDARLKAIWGEPK